MKKFLQWRKGYINGNNFIGNKPKGIFYQICRYYILNNTYEWWRVDMYIFSKGLEKNIDLFKENEKLKSIIYNIK